MAVRVIQFLHYYVKVPATMKASSMATTAKKNNEKDWNGLKETVVFSFVFEFLS